MKNWHTEKLTINDTNINFNSVVPVSELIKMFQVATFNHSHKMGLDHESMIQHSNAFWVITKIKLQINHDVQTQEKLSVTTWTHELGAVRALRDCVMKVNNSVKVKGVSEWCCLDLDSRKLRKLSTIKYPDLEIEKTKLNNLVFSNIKENVEEKDFVYSHIVRSTDIDLNNHTNNMVYNNLTLNAFSVEELKQFKIKEYEVYFVNESYEGDKIKIYKKKIKNCYYVEGKTDEKTIFRAVLKIKNI